jgi:hypothetical protein
VTADIFFSVMLRLSFVCSSIAIAVAERLAVSDGETVSDGLIVNNYVRR